jgi:hypothetical protein
MEYDNNHFIIASWAYSLHHQSNKYYGGVRGRTVVKVKLIYGGCRYRYPLPNPSKNTSTIGGKGEESSSRESIMEVTNMLKNTLVL